MSIFLSRRQRQINSYKSLYRARLRGNISVRIKLLLSALCLSIFVVSAFARPQRVQEVSFVEEGSVPQSPRLYVCARGLKGQVFNEPRARACLGELLASKFFERGEFSVKDRGSEDVELIFHLKSPPLEIISLNFELPEQETTDLKSWLATDTGGLRVGDVYRSEAEVKTFYGIQNFFRSRGRSVLFNSTVNLNYRSGNAQIAYRFVLGPRGPEETVLAKVADCPHRIKYLDLTGIDDDVPFSLIDQMLRVRAFSCFDRNQLKQDEKRMLASGLVKAANFSFAEDGEDREVSLVARGDHPFLVRSIDVVGFGKTLNVPSSQIAALPLRVGQKYRNSLAEESAGALQKWLSDSGHKISVTPQASLVDKELHVEFDVIVSPEDELYIDGERF